MAKKGEKNPRKSTKMGRVVVPVTPTHRAFCEEWLKDYDHIRAAKAAGFAENYIRNGAAAKLVQKYHLYLMDRKEKLEKAISKEIALEQKDILSEMMAIGFSNAQDYITITEEMIDGKTVIKRTLKPIEQLTRRQAAALSAVTSHPDGSVTYAIPDERSKHPYLKDLGQHLGLFHPKLIQEHRALHLHAQMDLKGVDPVALEKAEGLLLEAMGQAGKRMLGIIDVPKEDITDE